VFGLLVGKIPGNPNTSTDSTESTRAFTDD